MDMPDSQWTYQGIAFVCDDAKRGENLRKHGIDLREASAVLFMRNTPKKITLADGRVVYGETDWAAVSALTEEEITAAARLDPDAQPLTEEQLAGFRRVTDIPGNNILEKTHALVTETKNKQLVSIRYDKDVIAFFKAQGKGYQRLMNNVLRNYMKEHTSLP